MRDKPLQRALGWQPPLARERRSRRRPIVIAAAVGTALSIAAIVLTSVIEPIPRLLWNASASVPRGLYAVAPIEPIERGDIVVARLPRRIARLAAVRRYLPIDVPLVKPVAATPGDRVCAIGAAITINGRFVATRRERDLAGRPLPWWRGCVLLRNGRVFLLSLVPGSFDSRYFGPVEPSAIVGLARPLWTEPAHEASSS